MLSMTRPPPFLTTAFESFPPIDPKTGPGGLFSLRECHPCTVAGIRYTVSPVAGSRVCPWPGRFPLAAAPCLSAGPGLSYCRPRLAAHYIRSWRATCRLTLKYAGILTSDSPALGPPRQTGGCCVCVCGVWWMCPDGLTRTIHPFLLLEHGGVFPPTHTLPRSRCSLCVCFLTDRCLFFFPILHNLLRSL